MIRMGKVMAIEPDRKSCVIRDERGRDFFCPVEEMHSKQIPPLFSTVTFIRDEDYKSTLVACLVKLDRLPVAI